MGIAGEIGVRDLHVAFTRTLAKSDTASSYLNTVRSPLASIRRERVPFSEKGLSTALIPMVETAKAVHHALLRV